MGIIRKKTTVLPASGQSELLDIVRRLAGKELKSAHEWCIDDEKINCGTLIKIKINNEWVKGRFEILDDSPYLAPIGVDIKEGLEAEFL